MCSHFPGHLEAAFDLSIKKFLIILPQKGIRTGTDFNYFLFSCNKFVTPATFYLSVDLSITHLPTLYVCAIFVAVVVYGHARLHPFPNLNSLVNR